MRKSIDMRRLAPWIIAAAILLLWWKAAFLGLTPTIDDPGHLYEVPLSVIPALHLNFEIAKSGHLPLWSPYGQAGMILFADPEFTAAYPMTWVRFLLPTPGAFNAIILGQLILAALPLYYFLLRLRVSPSAALTASLVYAFSVPVTFGFLLPSRWTWQWLPLLLLLTSLYAETGRRAFLALIGLVWCVQMPTFIQSIYNMGLLLMPFALLYSIARAGTLRTALTRFFMIAAAVALGTGLASVYLFPLFEFKSQWAYKEFTYESATVGSFPPGLLLESLLAGDIAESPLDWTMVYYMGVPATLLALYALFRSAGRRAVLFFGTALAGCLLLAMGSFTPVYRLFYDWVPGASSFHIPMRMLYALPLLVAVLAALGLDRLLRRIKDGAPVTGDVLFLCALGAAFAIARWHGAGEGFLSAGTLGGLALPLAAAAALVAAARLKVIGGRVLIAGLIILIVLEARRSSDGIVFFDFSRKYSTPGTVSFLRSREGFGRFVSYNRGLDRYASSFLDEDSVPMIYPELSNYFGLYDIQARGPLRIERYDKLIKGLNAQHEIVYDLGFYMAEVRDYASPLINLFGVTHIVSKGELEPRDLVIYENPWELTLVGGRPFTLRLDEPLTTGEIYLRSFLEGAQTAAQGEAVATLTLYRGERALGTYEVQAGVHTAEVFDLNDERKRGSVAHGKGVECDSWDELLWDGRRLRGSHYRGAVDLGGELTFDRIEIEYIHPSGVMRITRIGCRPRPVGREGERFVPVFRDDAHGIIIYENRKALPRAFLVHEAVVAKGPEEALDRVLDDSFDFRNHVVLEEAAPTWFREGGKEDASLDDVTIVEYSPNRFEAAVRTRAPAFLFLSDIYYPGWESYVDGEKAATYRANYAFRAVAVPTGAHEVAMVFRPRSLRVGALFSAASLLGLVILLMLCRRGGPDRD